MVDVQREGGRFEKQLGRQNQRPHCRIYEWKWGHGLAEQIGLPVCKREFLRMSGQKSNEFILGHPVLRYLRGSQVKVYFRLQDSVWCLGGTGS